MSDILATVREPDIRDYVANLIFFREVLRLHPEMGFVQREIDRAREGIIAEAIKMYSPRRSA